MPEPTFHWIDGAVIVLYMLGMLVIGARFARRQESASEYLLASRSVGWFAVGLSLLASLNSAADYVVGPAQILEFGFMNLVFLLPVVISFPIIFKYFLPFYQRLPLYHCYEYLEQRFHVSVRVTVTLLFIVWRISWMGATIYLPAYVLNVVMGFDLYVTIIVLGVITTAYTAMGGVRGVIWTDVTQAIIMFIGLIVATWLVIGHVDGGFSRVWTISRDEGFMYFTAKIPEMATATSWTEKVYLYFKAPLTFWSIILLGTMSKLTSYGADQVMVQRYLTSRSIQDSKSGFILNSVAYVIYSVLFIMLGMALFAYFKIHPLPDGTKYEHMFPYFIGAQMPVVLKGLIIAAIYAAAQSSVSSGITAATSGIFSDFYVRLFHGHVSPEQHATGLSQHRMVWFSRICALALGILVTAFALVFKELVDSGNLFEAFRKVVGIFEGLLIPIFLLGMFSRRTGTIGVLAGAIAGFAAAYYWSFGTTLGFGWNTVVAFVVTIAVAHIVNVFTGAPEPGKLRWTWKEIMDRPDMRGGGVEVFTK